MGTWRILQRVGSHRWTTDDVVTAYVAKTEIYSKREQTIGDEKKSISYLDLGCGNASVLQMVSWGLMEDFDLTAFGIEARSEAVNLAKRSLAFNIGEHNIGKKISVINADFRVLQSSSLISNCNDVTNAIHNDCFEDFEKVKSQKFDLITGTPPYFRVDFSTEDKANDTTSEKIVTKAVINQG